MVVQNDDDDVSSSNQIIQATRSDAVYSPSDIGQLHHFSMVIMQRW
jgi:hypothetical protein